MINMFYWPIRLVEPTELTTPRGPNFKRARQETFHLKGSIITLKLPRHKPLNPGYDEPVNLKGEIDIDRAKIYLEEPSVGAWRKCVISHRSWRFNGPMFTGKLGDVSYSMAVYNCRYTQGESLFNPEQFEKALCNLLTIVYAEDKFRWAQSWKAPVNWQVHHRLNVNAASYHIKPTRAGELRKEFIFPIRNDTLVMLSFRQMLLAHGGYSRAKELVDNTPMEQLCNDIIDSLDISLSDESQQQLLDAQQAYPGAKLSEKMQALKWTTEEEDEKHAYYLSHRDEF